MSYDFFEQPILNSPYDYPHKHWELDQHGQPTFEVIEKRRRRGVWLEFTARAVRDRHRRSPVVQDQTGFDVARR